MTTIDRLFAWVRSSPFLYRFTLFTRSLLIAGFIPTGLVKLMGRRFTSLGVDSPVGAFFEAMYQTGLYWRTTDERTSMSSLAPGTADRRPRGGSSAPRTPDTRPRCG